MFLYSNDVRVPNSHSFRDFVSTFINFPKPLIAAVNGPAIGVSVTLLGLCDLVYAADNVSCRGDVSMYMLPRMYVTGGGVT